MWCMLWTKKETKPMRYAAVQSKPAALLFPMIYWPLLRDVTLWKCQPSTGREEPARQGRISFSFRWQTVTCRYIHRSGSIRTGQSLMTGIPSACMWAAVRKMSICCTMSSVATSALNPNGWFSIMKSGSSPIPINRNMETASP